ncbi:glycosyltransferase involved in cell wall biosynthesis [Allocatelliglobosispora scoriae]|uniref:4,4'-diaponeurosporenoate glycosyltransferase n=1 Tax=Allocatelliglobosispora scoriae TaxID=643052 RepID=A0A841BY82_9ACTN|nr:glycosyltransferase family 2 protein [Allocatelliglobosispora scoriae]MBB5872079.1 glycosyltransferase involved in cell wall biosynthesis [Allocatelliglobosispora scoriae]
MTSVVIPAHNEAAVIDRCLRRLPGDAEVIVIPNGCTDNTAEIARGHVGVNVIELAQPGKSGALRAGDAVAKSFPRIYLDADIELSPGAIDALVAAIEAGALAAVPRRELVLRGRPWTVRAYYAIHGRLPAVRDGLYGRGAIVLAEAARARFDEFPEAIADDLFLDSVVSQDERVAVADAVASVEAPAKLNDLVRRLIRVRAGNSALRGAATGVRQSDRWSWLRDVVAQRPWLLPAGVWYAGVTLYAAWQAGRKSEIAWGRDDSRSVSA